MMKGILSIILISGILFNSLYAGQVAQTDAQAVALNFFKITYPGQIGHNQVNAALAYTRNETDGMVSFYVFDIKPLNGFVIVSARDEVKPILAYSNESYFVTDFSQFGLNDWINKTAKQIHNTALQQIAADEHINNLWTSFRQGINPGYEKSSGVGPLLHTTWDQEPYYNALCPINPNDGQRSVTGCVATAMAQIMKYWNYPAQGVGSFSYVDDNAHGFSNNIGTLSANFASTTYQWTQMPNHLTSNNSAVATLMYQCGVSVAMDYSDGGSGAWVLQSDANYIYGYSGAPCAQHSYPTYFQYNPNTIRGVVESNYTATQWTNLIEGDLNIGRVIQYEGDDPRAGGHTWVCDGYDANNNLHMNWGWGGYANGYYAINNLNAGGYNFSTDDAALIGIVPLYPNVDTTCHVSAAFTYQNVGGSNIQFTNNSTSNHSFTSSWTFYNGAGQFATSNQLNPLVTFIGYPPYSAHLSVSDTSYGGCRDTMAVAINFNPNTVCLTLQQGATQAVGSNVEAFIPAQNFQYNSSFPQCMSGHWTSGGTPTEDRGLLKFDLSGIPAGSIIVSASLSLYADTNSVYDVVGQPTYGSDNASNLYMITSAWNPAAVTWNTQPSYTTSGAVSVPHSTVTDEDYTGLDVTAFVRSWVAAPSTNYGMALVMITQNHYNSMIFCSPGYPNANRWPKLQVCYIPPNTCNARGNFIQQNLGYGQTLFTNTSTDQIPFTSHWTFYNANGVLTTSTATNPLITFTGPTPYSATLIITDSVCSDTVSQAVSLVNCVSFQQGGTAATGADLEDFYPTTNFDFTSTVDFVTSHWTHGGTPTQNSSLLKFDLSSIPQGSVILSAKLSLYADTASPLDMSGQPMYGTDNASNIYIVTSGWNAATVDWSNQPGYSTSGSVSLPQSTAVDQDYTNLDISSFVQGWVNNPTVNYGVLLKMITQNHYNTMIFCSPGNANTAKWPKLDICYQVSSPCHLVATFTYQELVNGQVQFTNTSTNNNSTQVSWTFYNGNGAFATSNVNNPLITFTGPAPYSATIQLHDSISGCIDTLNQPVIITGCTTKDSFDYVQQNNGSVQFYNNSTSSNGFICNWTFTNANGVIGTSTQVNPLFTFSGPQPYFALLVVTDSVSRSCVDSFRRVVKIVTGLNEPVVTGDNMFIYPNPASSNDFNLQLPQGYDITGLQIKLVDITGREIEMQTEPKLPGVYKLTAHGALSAGLYNVLVYNANSRNTLKLIIVK